MSWREERRADQMAAAQAQAVLLAATAEQQRADRAQRAQQDRAAHREQQATRDARAKRRRAWLAGHLTDLLIYPLAVVSAVMAVPAMAAWGAQQYGNATGALLPAISELGMWAFAVSVQLTRARYPDRPVWALQLGVVGFAAANVALNFLHGQTTGGWSTGLVMAVVSVAGVAAHQLVTAGARRAPAERDAAHAARATRQAVRRYRQAALRGAVARISATGEVALLVTPGVYRLRRGRLASAVVPDLPSGPVDELDRELAALLAFRPDPPPLDHCGDDTGLTSIPGPVATLEPPGSDRPDPDLRPDPPVDSHRPDPRGDQHGSRRESTRPKGMIGGRRGRSIEQLRADLAAAIEADPTRVDPSSAESIRKALRCSPKNARRLRDEWRTR